LPLYSVHFPILDLRTPNQNPKSATVPLYASLEADCVQDTAWRRWTDVAKWTDVHRRPELQSGSPKTRIDTRYHDVFIRHQS